MNRGHWSETVRRCEERAEPYVIITVLGARGSTPRDSGTKMVVTVTDRVGTIGGGELEHRAVARATVMLTTGDTSQWVENYPLGEKLGQCCGGSTSLLFECFVPKVPTVLLFGAGHVGRALAPILAALPLRVRWVDQRSDEFPPVAPPNIRLHVDDDPLAVLASAPAAAYFVIMTHNHPLDYRLAEAALSRADAAYVGVIGSDSKARRFRLRLAHRGFGDADIAALHCPIGDDRVPGKEPAEIAVSVAAQLIAHYHSRSGDENRGAGPGWKQLQATLAADDPLAADEPRPPSDATD